MFANVILFLVNSQCVAMTAVFYTEAHPKAGELQAECQWWGPGR